MHDPDSAIGRALDAFQALLRARHTVNPTANRELIAAARTELAQLRARTSGAPDGARAGHEAGPAFPHRS